MVAKAKAKSSLRAGLGKILSKSIVRYYTQNHIHAYIFTDSTNFKVRS